MAWDLLSLVEICTVSRVLLMAASVTRVSGVARAKLPPMQTKTFALPFPHGPDGADGVVAGRPRGGEAELFVQGVVEPRRHLLKDAHGAVPLHVRMPAHRADPAPGRPMLPWSSSTLTMSLNVATACLCWVRPIAQVTIVALDANSRAARARIWAWLRPVALKISAQSRARTWSR
jgi:hypothetical protein